MNNFIKNILLLAVVLVLSYFTAEYFGSWYDKFAPQYDSLFGASKSITNSFIGFPFAYTFFSVFLFKPFGSGNRNKWIGWLLAPPLLFFAYGDLKHIYLPIFLALIGWGLTMLLKKAFKQ